MVIELQRAHTPEDYDRAEECGICGEAFRSEIVLAFTKTESWQDMELACPGCVEMLGRHKPGKFPTIEEYREALQRWDGPIWASIDEASAVERTADYNRILGANTISRS